MHMWRSEDNSQESVLSSPCGSRDQTQSISLEGKPLSRLSHLTGPFTDKCICDVPFHPISQKKKKKKEGEKTLPLRSKYI